VGCSVHRPLPNTTSWDCLPPQARSSATVTGSSPRSRARWRAPLTAGSSARRCARGQRSLRAPAETPPAVSARRTLHTSLHTSPHNAPAWPATHACSHMRLDLHVHTCKLQRLSGINVNVTPGLARWRQAYPALGGQAGVSAAPGSRPSCLRRHPYHTAAASAPSSV